MKKAIVVFLVLLAVISVQAIDRDVFYTDFMVGDGKALDTLEVDSVYFKVDNPMLDSVTTYYMQNASTDNPAVSCSLYTTPNDISPVGSYTVDQQARKATWTLIATVFDDYETENTMNYTTLTQDNIMSKPGMWYMMTLTAGATASHDETSKVLEFGLMRARKPD